MDKKNDEENDDGKNMVRGVNEEVKKSKKNYDKKEMNELKMVNGKE